MAGRPLRRARRAAEAAILEFAPLSPLQRNINDEHPILDYNDPNIRSKDFLLAVMHDSIVDLELRIRAPELLLPFTEAMPATVRVPTPVSHTPVLTVRIEGLTPGGDDDHKDHVSH